MMPKSSARPELDRTVFQDDFLHGSRVLAAECEVLEEHFANSILNARDGSRRRLRARGDGRPRRPGQCGGREGDDQGEALPPIQIAARSIGSGVRWFSRLRLGPSVDAPPKRRIASGHEARGDAGRFVLESVRQFFWSITVWVVPAPPTMGDQCAARRFHSPFSLTKTRVTRVR